MTDSFPSGTGIPVVSTVLFKGPLTPSESEKRKSYKHQRNFPFSVLFRVSEYTLKVCSHFSWSVIFYSVTVTITLTGSTFDLLDGHCDRHNHFACQRNILSQWPLRNRLVWTSIKTSQNLRQKKISGENEKSINHHHHCPREYNRSCYRKQTINRFHLI